jgi:uncharacterized protein (TIGR02271 family)
MTWLSAFGLDNQRTDRNMTDNDLNRLDQSDSTAWISSADGGEHHIAGYEVISDQGEPIGTISDYVFDGDNRMRYLVINTLSSRDNRQIAIPVGLADIQDDNRQVILTGVTQDHLSTMPSYNGDEGFSSDYDTRMMQSYYPDQQPYTTESGRLDYNRYQEFNTPQRLQLLEERLQINKHQELQGQVTVGKYIETRQETVDVPVSRERLVVERTPVHAASMDPRLEQGDPNHMLDSSLSLDEQQITVPLYREEVDVSKRAVVAEEVSIRKEQDTEVRTVTETVGREELDVSDPNRLMSGADRDTDLQATALEQDELHGEFRQPDRTRARDASDNAESSSKRQKGKIELEMIRMK